MPRVRHPKKKRIASPRDGTEQRRQVPRLVLLALLLPASIDAAPLAEAFRTPEYRAMWGLETIHAADAYARGYSGKDVSVAVIDSGDLLDHPDFALRARSAGDLFGAPGRIAGSHSTNVAGLVGAGRDGVGMHGVAYEANLIVLSGISAVAEGTDSAIRIREAVDMGAKVINGSYAPVVYQPMEDDGGNPYPGYTPQSQQTLHTQSDGSLLLFDAEAAALRYAAAHDVLTVYAGGNERIEHPVAASQPGGFGLLPFIKPGNHEAGIYRIVGGEIIENEHHAYNPDDYTPLAPDDPRLRNFDFSDLEGTVIAAVAVDKNGKIASYSNTCGVAWRWCIAAPGGDDPAYDGDTGTYLYTTKLEGGYEDDGVAGTSFATPIVAGSAAVLRQAYPYMTARQIAEVLLTSADRSGHLADRHTYGRGLLDLGRAIGGPVEFGAEGFAAVFDIDTKDYDSAWTNPIGGRGGMTKRGNGTLTLTAVNSYTGPTKIEAGTLAVTETGSIARSALRVEKGAALSGTGTVGNADIGGTVAPGAPGSALRVSGDLVHRREGSYVAALSRDGRSSDRIQVQGAARIEGATLQLGGISPASVGKAYTLLQANGGVQGGYAPADDPYVFVDLPHGVTAADPTRYRLAVQRNDTPFSAAAHTRNQRAVARALDSGSVGWAPYDTTLMATRIDGLARQFELLSGEAHAGTMSVLSMQAARSADQALARSRQMQAGVAMPDSPVAIDNAGKALWGLYIGSRDRLAGHGNAATLQARQSGLLFGSDVSVTLDTRVGAMAGFGNGSIDAKAAASKSRVDSYLLGVYGATRFGTLQLRYGTSYSWHAVSTQRDTGLWHGAQARYRAGIAQSYAEAGLPYRLGLATVEPYTGIAYMQTHRSAFQESGQVGLRARASRQQLGYTTLGLRSNLLFALQDGVQLSLRGGAGWRRMHGDTAPVARMRFAQGADFDVTGASVTRDALLFELSAAVQSGRGMRFGIGYTGQLAHGGPSHAMRASFNWAF